MVKCRNGCNCDHGELENGLCYGCRQELEEKQRRSNQEELKKIIQQQRIMQIMHSPWVQQELEGIYG